MVTEIPLKKQEQAPLSSTATIRQCLPCVQEGLSVLQSPKFSLCIGHFARFDLRHFTLPALFVLRGGGDYPRLASRLSLTFPAFPWVKVNKRASQDRRHGRPDRSRKKQKKVQGKPFKNRVASWQGLKLGQKGRCQQLSCLKFQMNWRAMETYMHCENVQRWNMCLSKVFEEQDISFGQSCEKQGH